jgi:hypothetical protein
MQSLGSIGEPGTFHFAPMDLYARNILVMFPDTNSIEITGMLDWATRSSYRYTSLFAHHSGYGVLEMKSSAVCCTAGVEARSSGSSLPSKGMLSVDV